MDYRLLYSVLKTFFRKYVETDETEIGFLVLYGIATHFYQKYQAFPILHITGDFATGKNRRLDLLKSISLNPIVLISPSTASLFRTVDEQVCTLMIDEADSLLNYRVFETFLLGGYNKGGKISRAAQANGNDRDFKVEFFEVYCPKVLVTREGIQSEPLNSRSITIITSPKSKSSKIPNILPENVLEEGRELKKGIETLVVESRIEDIRKIELGLINRDAQIFECITDVASILGEEAIIDLKNFVERVYIPETANNTRFSFHGDLVKVLSDLYQTEDRIYVQAIHERLKEESDDHKDVTVKRIGRVLRSLKFVLKPDNKKTYVVRDSQLMDNLRMRYLADSSNVQITDNANNTVPRPDSHSVEPISVDGVASVVRKETGESGHRQQVELIAKALGLKD